MMFRRSRATGTALVLAALMLPAEVRSTQDRFRTRELCFAYVLELVTGDVPEQVNSSELRETLRRRGYLATTYPRLDRLDPVGTPGDVLVIGDAHAAIWVTPTILNHLFGETLDEAIARSWTIADLAAFTRTRDPVTGGPVHVSPFAGLPAEVWSPPAGWKWRVPPRVYLEPRCPSRNPHSGLQCRELSGHGGSHADWSQETWGGVAEGNIGERGQAGRPPAAPARTDDETAARIDLLLQNARVYRERRSFEAAVDALEEATRLAGGRPERGRPGGPHAERVLRDVADLRALLAREGDALSGKVADTSAGLADRDWALRRLWILDEATRTDWEREDPATEYERRIDTVDQTLANEGPFTPPGSGEPTAIVAAIRSSADSICAATDAARAGAAWNEIDRQSRIVDAAVAAAENWWARRRGDETFALSISHLSGLRWMNEFVRQKLGGDDNQLRTAMSTDRAAIDSALEAYRRGIARVLSLRAEIDVVAKAYIRAGALGPFGENQSAAWIDQCEKAVEGINANIKSAETLRSRVDALANRQNDPALATLRRRLATQQTRIESLERALLERDKLASWMLTAAEEVQGNRRRAEDCLQRLTARPAAPTRTQPSPPPQQTRQPVRPEKPPAGGATVAQPSPPPQPPSPPTQSQQPVTPSVPPQKPPADAAVSPSPADPNTAGGIRIRVGTAIIAVGQRVQFVATDHGNRPYTTNVTWTSLREDLLTIDAQGWASGIQPGRVTVQGRYGDDMSATIDVEVVPSRGGFKDLGGSASRDPNAVRQAPAGGFKDLGGTAKADASGEQPRDAQTPRGRPVTQPETQRAVDLLGVSQAGAGSGQVGTDAAVATQRQAGSLQASPPSPTPLGQPTSTPPRLTIAAGQPAAWHIFATGSRLGWAGGLSRYSVGPADQSIIEHLQTAGEHVMWANRESRPPTLAWTDWANTRATFRTWAERLQRNPAADVRRQIAVGVAGQISGLGQALTYQTVGTTDVIPNCDGVYVRLGYDLGYGSQVMQIADEAARNGVRRAAVEPRQDALSHLQTASSILSDYERIVVASGRCADLRDVRTLLHRLFALDSNDVAAQAATATAAWELANERIAALAGAVTGGARRVQPTPPPATARPGPTTAPAASAASGGTPFESLLADPGELEGFWAGWAYGGQTAVLRFAKQGREYVGTYEDAPDKEFGYADGDVVFRGRRVGANAYEGRFRVRRVPRPEAQGLFYDRGEVDEQVTIAVAGAYFWLRGPARPYPDGRSFTFAAEQFCARIIGPRPWRMPDGAPLDTRRTNYTGGALGMPVWFLAKGTTTGGQDTLILYPDLAAIPSGGAAADRRIQQGTARFGDQLNKDPLSARWLSIGFVPAEGPLTAMQAAARVATFPR